MEEETRRILRQALNKPRPGRGLGSRIHKRYAAIGGVELERPAHTEPPRAADLDPPADRGTASPPSA